MTTEEIVTIEGKVRTGRKKGYARKLRLTGSIPGIILSKHGPTAIELETKLLSKAWQAGKVFDLLLDGQKKRVKIQELQIKAKKRTPLHVDLMYV